jgi:hypothetical protein
MLTPRRGRLILFGAILCVLFNSIFLTSRALAQLSLDPPEVLMSRATQGRQELRDVVITLQQQLPEMRSQSTFESYFFLLDQLDVLAGKFELNDVFPGAIKALGTRMTLFAVKWIDLTLMPQSTFSYYVKWFDGDGFANLLGTTNYILQTLNKTEYDKFKRLAENIDFLISKNLEIIRVRPDLVLGYRELISDLAIRYIQRPEATESEKEYWFQKIYTAQGLSLFLDSIQVRLYGLDVGSKLLAPQIFRDLIRAYEKLSVIIDFSTFGLKDRTSELAVEYIKKCFELNLPLTRGEIDSFISQFGSRSLQLLATSVASTPENFLIDNATTLESLYSVLLPRLVQNGLVTDSNNFDMFVGRSLAAFKVRALGLEGTYKVMNSQGRVFNFTLLSAGPLDLSAALVDDKWMTFRNYFYVRYSPESEIFTASYAQYDYDIGQPKSVIKFKFDKKSIAVTDEYAMIGNREFRGPLSESVAPLRFSQKVSQEFTRTLTGKIKFKLGVEPRLVTMIVQSNGQNITARLQDGSGPILDFNQGLITAEGTLILNTGRLLNTTWAQLRGTMSKSGLRAIIIVGGRGQTTEEFILK